MKKTLRTILTLVITLIAINLIATNNTTVIAHTTLKQDNNSYNKANKEDYNVDQLQIIDNIEGLDNTYITKEDILKIDADINNFNEFKLHQEQKDNTLYNITNLHTQENLIKYAELYLKDNFNLTLSIPITFTDTPEGINGYFWHTSDTNKSLRIEISTRLQKQDSHIIEHTLIHELNHYALNELNLDYADGQTQFEKLNYLLYANSNYTTDSQMMQSKLNTTCCD